MVGERVLSQCGHLRDHSNYINLPERIYVHRISTLSLPIPDVVCAFVNRHVTR